LLLIAIRSPDNQGVYSGATRLEVSRHHEGDIPDGLAGELISRMRGDFKAGRFDQATSTGVQTILATLAARRGISMDGIDQNYAYQPEVGPAGHPGAGELTSLILIGGIVMLILWSAIRRKMSGPGSLAQPGAAGSRSPDWTVPIILGGGGFGGYRGGSGPFPGGGGSPGGFGGFGGGGDFGGGGATSSW